MIWAEAEEIIEFIVDKREIIGYSLIKIMADGGKGFFKICMSIFPETYLQESDNLKKRTTYSEGGSAAKKSKLTSVHRLIMLCCVPDIKESYENVKILFDKTKIDNISCKF